MRLGPRLSHRRSDGGETLLEILMAIAITGIVVVGLVSGLTTAIFATDSHRHLTDVEVVARQYGEALVNQAYHPATAEVASLSGTSLTVNSVEGTFPGTPFFVAIDAEAMKVKTVSGNSWTLADPPAETHSSGAQIVYDVVDDACLTPTNLQPSYTVPAGARYVQTPTITTPLEFFDSTGSPISGGCANYWSTALPCRGLETAEHLTECDPALVRVTITAATGAASPSQASTTTRVLIRRGDA